MASTKSKSGHGARKFCRVCAGTHFTLVRHTGGPAGLGFNRKVDEQFWRNREGQLSIRGHQQLPVCWHGHHSQDDLANDKSILRHDQADTENCLEKICGGSRKIPGHCGKMARAGIE